MRDTLNLVHRFDPDTKKHCLNNWNTVLHCHHYAVTFTELAHSAGSFDGIKKMVASAEQVFGMWLKEYYHQEAINPVVERAPAAEQYWKTIGMGLIWIVVDGPAGGRASMDYSHIDAGWLQKIGSGDYPVNFITRGFLGNIR